MSSNETLLSGRYLLQALQGSGGMAVIYKAQDQALGRTVAVKVLRPSIATDPMFIARFRNEARAIANLSHPNIVTVHDVGEHQSATGLTHYMVMEYVNGSDLKKVIREKGMLSVDFALNYAIQICAGIGFAHRSQIVHADVKPQNVLLTQDNLIKVTDFGIAQALSDTQTTPQRENVVWGSPHYFSPEQARGEKPTAASDVYSIGIVMFEMLTGQLPYNGANQQELALAHIRGEIPMVTDFNANVPEALAKTIYKVMSKEPSARYRTADQLGHILINIRDKARENTMSAPPVPPSASKRPPVPQAKERAGAMPPPPPPPASQVSSNTPPPAPPPPPPTMKMSPAPSAPNPDPYNRQQVVQPVRPLQEQFGAGAPPPPQSPATYSAVSGQSGMYDPRMVQPRSTQPQERLIDGATAALIVIALIALLGLIILYIAVFQAYAG